MNPDEQFDALIGQYYREIYCYCLSKLKSDTQGAEDCAQEVFLLFTEKKDALDLDGNIRAWLYQSAQYIINEYLRVQTKHSHLPIEDAETVSAGEEGALFTQEQMQQLRDILTEQELDLLLSYYAAKRGERKSLAALYGMTLPQLYDEAERLKRLILCAW